MTNDKNNRKGWRTPHLLAPARIISLAIAWFAAIPYHLDPPPETSGGLLSFAWVSLEYMLGVVPWLINNPANLLLMLPAVVLILPLIVRPPLEF